MIISKEELKKNVDIRYNTDTEELEATIKVVVSIPMCYQDVCSIEETKIEDQLIDYLREKLRNLGGVE